MRYEVAPDDIGLRLIAVGGLSLSRGLTLEGLCTSYFYRNSSMYDTLMQMGLWFGYRGNYQDMCKIWMPEVSMAWYSYISAATDAVAAVLPPELLSRLLDVAEGKPVLRAVSRREPTGKTHVLSDGQKEQEFVFVHDGWEQVLCVQIRAQKL